MTSHPHIAVLGVGAWGTALAQLYAAQSQVTLWCHREELANKISDFWENKDYLPGVKLNPSVRVTADSENLKSAQLVLAAVPTQYLPTVLLDLKDVLPNAPVVICAKGIYLPGHALLPDAVQKVLPDHDIAILSGPNLAPEIARGQPAAATIAAEDKILAETLATQLQTPTFRPYASTDVVGVALAGALKNIIALAAGMATGAGLGENARAALITRGLAEITRLGMAMSAKAETFMGLAGVGDLMLTCHAETSRNFSCGFALGQGKTLAAVLAERKSVTEGVTTTRPALAMAATHNVEMPICQGVADVLEEKTDVRGALMQLMARPLKTETT